MKFSITGQAVTPVPTIFLKKHLCDAPQDYVRVYLYGLYLAHEGGGHDGLDMEQALHLSAEQIVAAFKYWQARGLVWVEGENVRFGQAPDTAQAVQTQAVQAEPTHTAAPAHTPASGTDMYPYAEYHAQLQKALGRALIPAEIEKLHDYTTVFGLPREVVLVMIEHCVARAGKTVSIAYLDKVAQSWAGLGLTTVEKAREYVEDHTAVAGGARVVLRRMGITGKNPDNTQQELYAKWTQTWGFTQESILFAMQGVEFPSGAPFKYLDAILRKYYENGITTSSGMSVFSEQRDKLVSETKEILRALDYSRQSIRPSHERYMQEWRQAGYTHQTVLLACAQAVSDGTKSFKAVDTLLREWRGLGMVTDEEIQRHIKKQDQILKRIEQVYASAGIKKQIGDADRKWYNTCRNEYKINHDVLMYAADISSLANEPASFLRKVISEWAKKGITTLKAAMEQNMNRYAADMKNGKTFEQHKYTAEEEENQKLAALKRLENMDD